MNDHTEYKILISAYIDGECTPQDKERVESHLLECPECQKYFKDLNAVSSSLKKWPDETLSSDHVMKIQKRLGEAKEGQKMRQKSKVLSLSLSAGALAVTIAMVLVVNTVVRQHIVTQPLTIAGLKTTFPVKKAETVKLAAAVPGSKPASPIITGEVSAPAKEKDQRYEPYYLASNYEVKRSVVHAENLMAKVAGAVAAPMSRSRVRSSSDDIGEQFLAYDGARYDMPVQGVMRVEEKEAEPYRVRTQQWNTEGYEKVNENQFLTVRENALSTFSIDVDTASYSNIRRFLNAGQMPPKDSVRIEEMINYFEYNYPQPEGDRPFSITTEVAACPWNPAHQLALIGLQGKKIQTENLPPSNLVFLIDVSGSMDEPNKLPLLKSAFNMLVDELRAKDQVSIVVYAGNAGLVLDTTSGDQKTKIHDAIDRLEAGGSTAGGAGIQLAYKIAKEHLLKDGNNRVILATDGDFNVGASSDAEMERLIEEKRADGIYLTTLGFGTGNYKDSKMEKLADKGNGNYYYIDTEREAKKVLVHGLTGTLLTIAKDVKVQIEFNPAVVKAYRLIGYENRIMAKEDFNNDKKDAGEIGAGHSVTALYEIVPAGSSEEFGTVDPLKYQQPAPASQSSDLMTVKLRYKDPDATVSKLISEVVKKSDIAQEPKSENFRWAASVAEFGLLLRDSEFKGNASYLKILEQAKQAKGTDSNGYRDEFLQLVEKAGLLQKPGHQE